MKDFNCNGLVMIEIDKNIPNGWTREVVKKGRGVRWYDNKGNAITVNYSYKDSIPGQGHGGPYMNIAKNGTKTKILLEGNPDL